MGDAWDSRSHWQRQTKHCASRQSDGTTHKEVQMVAGALLQVVGWTVHNDAGQVLVQVSQDCKANRGNDGKCNAPCWEVCLNAIGVHNPWALFGGTCQSQSGGNALSINLKHPQRHVVGVDGCQGRCRDQWDRDRKVGQQVAERSQHPWCSAHAWQVGSKAKGVEEKQRLKEAVCKRHHTISKVCNDRTCTVNDEDQTDESCKDVLRRCVFRKRHPSSE